MSYKIIGEERDAFSFVGKTYHSLSIYDEKTFFTSVHKNIFIISTGPPANK